MRHNLQASRNLNGTLPIFRHKKHDNSSNTNLPQLARVCAIAQQTSKTISPPFGGLTHRCRHHCWLPGHCVFNHIWACAYRIVVKPLILLHVLMTTTALSHFDKETQTSLSLRIWFLDKHMTTESLQQRKLNLCP